MQRRAIHPHIKQDIVARFELQQPALVVIRQPRQSEEDGEEKPCVEAVDEEEVELGTLGQGGVLRGQDHVGEGGLLLC